MLLLLRSHLKYVTTSILFLFFTSVNAQLVLDQSLETSTSIHPYVQYTNTGQQSYTLDEIRSEEDQLSFVPLQTTHDNIGFTNDYIWARFQVSNPTDAPVEYLLETARPIIDTVNLYTVNRAGVVTKQESGDAIPFSKRSVKNRKSMFRLQLAPGETQYAYIQIKSDGESLALPVILHPYLSALNITYSEQIFYGLFYGILLLASIIYLFFFTALRNSTFLYYGLYVVFIGLLQFSVDGFFFQYVMPNGGWLYDRWIILIAFAGAFFLGKYGERFLRTRHHLPVIHKIFNALYIAMGISVLLLFLVPSLRIWLYPTVNVIGLLTLFMVIASIVSLEIKGERVDRFFITGIAFLVAGFVIFILNNFNAISNSFLSENAPKFGTGLEVIFLSISMSNLIRKLRVENEENQKLALQRARDMNEIKSSFLSNISHELRTPLNLIMGVTSSLHHFNNDKHLRDKYELILSSSKTLLNSIDDILNFTIIEKGDQVVKNRPFDLRQTVEGLQNVARQRSLHKGLEFSARIDPNIPTRIIGDRAKLTQIIQNLVDNAIKFTEEGGIQFFVHNKYKRGKKTVLTFEIVDTGIGISDEKMQTIFESFTKKSFEHKREFGGLGLGLYIAKTFVDLQDGEISLKNNEYGGVTCKVQLEYKLDIAKSRLDEEELHNPEDLDLNNCKILLMEDNEMNQMVIRLLVSKWENTSLKIAGNGREGLQLLKNENFDVILMDLQMPVMDGFEATAAIRGGQAGLDKMDTPIIAVTADITDKTKQQVLDLGVDDYLTKPVDGDQLLEKIRHYIKPKAYDK